MNKQEAIAALGGIEGARKTIEAADPGAGPFCYPRFEKEHAICTLALSALDAPAGDGWAALERLRARMFECWQERIETKKRFEVNTPDRREAQGEANAFQIACFEIDRELAARPAKEPGLTIAETEKHMAALCDEDAEVEQWERDAICRPLDGPPSPPDFAIFPECIAEAVRIMRERGAAVKRAEWERNVAHGRAAKAEAEVARLKAVVEKIKEATK